MADYKAAPILRVENLKQHFRVNGNFTVRAVDNVSFDIYPGETYGLVGESGSGKSTIGRSVIRLYTPTAGKIVFKDRDITGRTDAETTKILRTKMQMIFQDPYSCLNPRMDVKSLIEDSLKVSGNGESRAEREEKVYEAMNLVGLEKRLATSYPHELDGGRRQRIGVARALALNPKFIVCDEPVSALDVSIQETIIQLLVRLQREKQISIVFICHDLALVQSFSHQIAVMYLGHVVEVIPGEQVARGALHPYTQALLSALFSIHMEQGKKIESIQGEAPSPLDIPQGCPFQNRCPHCGERCRREKPQLVEVGPDHLVACHEVAERKKEGGGAA